MAGRDDGKRTCIMSLRQLGIGISLCLGVAAVGLLWAAQEPKPKPAAKPAATAELAGRWLAIISDGQGNDFQFALIDVTGSSGKTAAKLAGAFEEFEKPKLEKWTVEKGKISFKLNAGNAEFTFSGQQKGKLVRGELLHFSGNTFPARMEPADESLTAEDLGPKRSPQFRPYQQALEEEEIQPLVDFASKNPESPLSMYALATALGLAKDEELGPAETEKLAKQYLTAATEWGPTVEAQSRFQVGQVFASMEGLQERALPHLDAVLKSQVTDRIKLAATTTKVQILLETGKGDEALAVGEGALAKNPFDAGLTYALAKTAEELKKPQQALDLYGQIAAVPMMEPQVARMLQQESRLPLRPSQLPTARLQSLWKDKHGGLKGLEEFILEKYEAAIAAARPKTAPPKAARTGNRVALFELFTGQACAPCVGADVATTLLEKDFGIEDVVVLRYHQNIPAFDPLANSDTRARFDEYEGQGTPTLIANGEPLSIAGFMDDAGPAYLELHGLVARTLVESSPVTVKATAKAEGRKIQISAQASGKDLDDLQLRVVLAETRVPFKATNGIRVHEMVVRSISKQDEPKNGMLSSTFSVDVDDLRKAIQSQVDEALEGGEEPAPDVPLDLKSFRVVAFVQKGDNGEVLQTKAVDVAGQLAAAKAE